MDYRRQAKSGKVATVEPSGCQEPTSWFRIVKSKNPRASLPLCEWGWGAMMQLKGIEMTTERIEINPAIMMGKPVIRGTRIMVELILRKLAEGASEGELVEDYPHLTTEAIRAAMAYGAASVAHEEVVLLSDGPVTTKP